MEQSAPQPPPVAIPITPVVRSGTIEPAREVSMVDVTVSAFTLTGLVMTAALVAGLLAGAGYVWFRSKRAVTIIEARGGNHNFLRE